MATAVPTETVADLAARIEKINRENGWYDDDRTYGDDLALLHSEVSEALEAYRDHGFADVTVGEPITVADLDGTEHTTALPKPEGFGSELADVVIRLLDTYTRRNLGGYPWWWNRPLSESRVAHVRGNSVGDWIAYLHKLIAAEDLSGVLGYVRGLAAQARVDLAAEIDRKLAYNATRGHRHGGKRL